MWTREIDARIAKLIPDLETGFGVRFPKAPWLDEGHQGAVTNNRRILLEGRRDIRNCPALSYWAGFCQIAP